MNTLISPHQSSFIKGRQILDGTLLVGELIYSCKKHNTKAILLKLLIVRRGVSLGSRTNADRKDTTCVMSASPSVPINSSISSFFRQHVVYVKDTHSPLSIWSGGRMHQPPYPKSHDIKPLGGYWHKPWMPQTYSPIIYICHNHVSPPPQPWVPIKDKTPILFHIASML